MFSQINTALEQKLPFPGFHSRQNAGRDILAISVYLSCDLDL